MQCKQTLTSIGRPEVAQLYGHIDPNKEHALFVTLGEYTAQARQFERAKQGLRLITGKDLVNMISHHYERFEPRYQMLLPMKKVYIPTVVSGEGNYD